MQFTKLQLFSIFSCIVFLSASVLGATRDCSPCPKSVCKPEMCGDGEVCEAVENDDGSGCGCKIAMCFPANPIACPGCLETVCRPDSCGDEQECQVVHPSEGDCTCPVIKCVDPPKACPGCLPATCTPDTCPANELCKVETPTTDCQCERTVCVPDQVIGAAASMSKFLGGITSALVVSFQAIA